MAADEGGTLARFKSLRGDHFEPAIRTHGGHLVGEAGDSLLVEFTTATEAVACAVEVQRQLAELNAELPEDRRMRFRIGINLGEVIVDGATIHGDGVNIAARLEKLAEPGEIVIARGVHDHIKGKVSYRFEDLGEKSLHNIAEPVRAYRIASPTGEATVRAAVAGEPALALPSKPSIAVLPFTNMSGDPEQDYFADGITEDLITALSKIRWFFVIARNSTFAFKGKPVDVSEVGQRLGVRYVLEGSLRKGGNRVRVSAQLVEAASGHHVWAERYDREIHDVFALQDEMTETIIRAIEPELSGAERERAMRKPPNSLDTWDLFQRGLWHQYRFTKEDNAEARRFFHRAVEADPTFAQAHAALAHAIYWDALFGYASDAAGALSNGLDHARQAVALDNKEPFAHFALGRVQTMRAEHDAAITELERAIEINANFAHAYYGLGWALILAGRPAEALERIDTAIRLNPNDPAAWTFYGGRAFALYFLGRLDEAADWARRSARSATTGLWAHVIEAVVLAQLGHAREAASALTEARRLKPDLSTAFVREVMPFRDPAHAGRVVDGLVKAGLPDA